MRKAERALSTAATLVALAIVAGGCSKARGPARVADPIAATRCTGCHGGVNDGTGAPPRAISGAVETASPAVGAHAAHVGAGPLARAFTCGDCHPDPRDGSRSHADGTVDIAFGSLATGGGALSPAYDRAGAHGCSATYCHGAFRGGNAGNTPIWTRVDGTQAACGTCHGVPPPDPHPQRAECGQCHEGYTATTVDPTTHVDGVVQLERLTCTSCHGDPDRTATGIEPLAASAPPSGSHGETLPSQRAVGAHERHVLAGALSGGLACRECHPVPGSALHADGTVQVSWGPLAKALGAAPAWNGATCSSTYCHGSFRGGNAAYSPTWTQPVASACGTCHGVPPPAPHPQLTECGGCHPGYTATSVNVSAHVNGAVEVGGMTCSSCHGDPTRQPTATNPQRAAAPPTGTRGETLTTDRAVGAHQQHLGAGALDREIACTECHPVPTSMSHMDGTVELAWGQLATTAGAAPRWDGTRCSSTYCHGNFGGGNRGYSPDWTQPSTTVCGTCHGLPPPAPHPRRAECLNCHPPITGPEHVNGVVDLQGLTCSSCHGDPTRLPTPKNPQLAAAPPSGTGGEALTTDRAVGAHQLHLASGLLAGGVACQECHDVPSSLLHATGTVELSWGPLARTGGTAPSWNGATCASTYCHGAFRGGNAGYTPDWTHPAGNSCGTCHGVPPAAPHPQNPSCGNCHPGYDATTVNPALHVNGTVEYGDLTCTSCHGNPSRGATPENPQLAAAPPYGTAGQTDATTRAVGAHQRHLTAGSLTSGIACTECHLVPTSVLHENGAVELAWGPVATTGNVTPTWNGTTCAAAYCHGNFRNGNRDYAPDWTRPAAVACGTCHGLPPTGLHPVKTACGTCHPGAAATSVDPTTHVNGSVDLLPLTCTSCHGDASRLATPGADANVRVAPPDTATGRAPGAHLAHANRAAVTVPVGCGECHDGTFDFSEVLASAPLSQHPTGQLVVTFAGRAAGPAADSTEVAWSRAGASPSYDAGALSCGTTYCHGSYAGTFSYTVYDEASASYTTRTAAFAGNGASPSWTGGPMTCGSCHGNPPATGVWHLGHAYPECQWCHPDATGTGATGTAITVPSQHVDGAIQLAPRWSSRCFGCH